MAHDLNAVFYADYYHPIQAGSIDGTDTAPHDNAVYRAMLATSTGLYDPMGDSKAQGNPYCIVFVGRLARETTEATIEEAMSKFGKIKNVRLVRHIVTGASQGYAFVEYETEKEMRRAYEAAHQIRIDGRPVLVDYNRQLLMPGWIPRRLGGGLGGRKESGQLRFGGRDRPFRKPLRPIPQEELEKLGIPLPGRYMSRFETPPLPKRISDLCNKRTSSQHDDKEMSHHSYGSTKREKTIEKVTLEEHDSERRHTHSHARGSDTYSEVDKKWHHKRYERKEEGDKGHHHHHYRSDKYQHEEDDRWGYRSHASKQSSHKEAYVEDALERREKRKDYQTSEEMKCDHSSEKDAVMHEEDDKEDQLERREKKKDRRKGDDMKHHRKKHEKRREHRSDKKEPKESVYLDKDDEQEEDKTAAYEKHGRKKDHHRKDDRKRKHNWDGSKDYEKDEPPEHKYSHQEDAVAEGVSHSNRQHKRRRSSKVDKSSSEDDRSERDAKRKKEEGQHVKGHRSRRSLSREQSTEEKPFRENDPSFETR